MGTKQAPHRLVGGAHRLADVLPGERLAATHQPRSLNSLIDLVLGARLDDELYTLLHVEESRNVLRATLIETYFAPAIRPALVDQAAVNAEAYQYSQTLLEQARSQQTKETMVGAEAYAEAVRDQGFRRAVVTAYERCCAFCGTRITTPDGHSVVDAAHIVPWSVSHDDNPRNGMALCRICHWVFDEGLASVSDGYEIMMSRQLSIQDNRPGHLPNLIGRTIIRPSEQELWPDVKALGWHRNHRFRKW